MRRRIAFVALAIGAILVAGVGWWWWWERAIPGDGPLVLSGNVEVRQVNLGFKVAGRVQGLMADEGGQVTEGQNLAVLDKVYFEESLAQTRAQRDAAKATLAKLMAGNRPEEIAQAAAAVTEREATLANAKQAFERAEELLKKAAGTRKTYDDALSARREAEARLNSAQQSLRLMQAGTRQEDIDAARAQLAEREATVQASERALLDSELKAPSSGTVLSRVREVGAIVQAGETVFVLSLTSPVWVRGYVSELDLARVRPGLDVDVRVDAPGIAPLKGRIGFISPTAEFTPKTVETRELRTALVYRLRVVVDDPAGVLRQGMPVSVAVPQVTAVANAGRDAAAGAPNRAAR